jgi:ABC-type Mn2+/Zn2+ transport system ATPase subunit
MACPGRGKMQAAIDISDLEVRYKGKIALQDINISVPKGLICGLVGMNGAGKSTLFNAIMHAIPIVRGEVSLLGESVASAQKKGIVAYVPQTELIDWDFPVSVYDVIMMGRYGFMNALRIPSRHDKELVEKAISRVHLTEYKERQIGQLSGGQRKRAFVGRALAQGASILLLDEPFAGVDIKTENSLIALLQELKKQGVTTLITAHNIEVIGTYCDNMILINKTIIAAGPTKKVFTKENITKTYGCLPNRNLSL